MGGAVLVPLGPGFLDKTSQQEHGFNVTQELGWLL
jgi:hypothetical protein